MKIVIAILVSIICLLALPAAAQTPAAGTPPPAAPAAASPVPGAINIQIGGGTEQGNVSTAIQVLVVMTLLTLAPSIIMLMTSFTRIVIVLGFVRTAIGVQNAPANQIIVGLSLF
jgi:flagellar biosynthetic protein FliP